MNSRHICYNLNMSEPDVKDQKIMSIIFDIIAYLKLGIEMSSRGIHPLN